MDTVKLTPNQNKSLVQIVAQGKIDYKELDGRSVRALANRGLVKVAKTNKGTFVKPTARGKKLN